MAETEVNRILTLRRKRNRMLGLKPERHQIFGLKHVQILIFVLRNFYDLHQPSSELKTLLHPAYFPSIATFAVIAQKEIQWEVEDNYQKQTYRNRCYVCTDQGRHMLSIPIQHVGGIQGRQQYKDVRLDNSYPWQREHWRTLQTAYRTSPFFEYYEDDIAPLYETPHKKLLDFNLKTIATICECLQINMPDQKTSAYNPEPDPEAVSDLRLLVNAKRDLNMQQEKYTQVFGDRHGFVKNASILDLLFNEGTNTLAYLKKQAIDFLDV